MASDRALFAVYDALAQRVDPATREVSMSLSELAAVTWYGRDWVWRAVQRLKQDGVIEVVRPGDPVTKQAAVYRLFD